MKQYIGLSLPKCIKDLIEGKLGNNAQVLIIIAETMFEETNGLINPEEVYKAYTTGGRANWIGFTKEQVEAVFNCGIKIYQPRLHGELPPNTVYNHWIDLEKLERKSFDDICSNISY